MVAILSGIHENIVHDQYNLLQGIASYKNIQLCMIIIFTSNWIFLRARAHMRARKCALRTNAHNAGTRVRLLKQIGPIVDKKPVRRQLDWYEEEEIRTDPDLILIGQCEATLVWDPETGKSSDQDK